MKIADLYIRVSTDEQADKGYSQRDQEERLQKYCQANEITVRKIVYEDHSAKTFNRPEWEKLIGFLKKNKRKSDFVLFTKWDRFSRNAPDAYQMINILRGLGVEPQAIEQPLDMTVPENKMMLAIYLTAPEIENDRRGLNVFYGMRRARKEGRWPAKAPVGYVNRISECGKKYIAIDELQAPIMRWAFEEIAKAKYSTEQVFNKAYKMGLKCRKNNFFLLIRNPVYYGKIPVPKFKDEEEQLVNGQHEPLISSHLFYKVQAILNGKHRVINTKILSPSQLPLRGYLNCSKCTRTLCGSASKGRNAYYYYYHCSSICGCRHKAVEVNNEFLQVLTEYTLNENMAELFKYVIVDAYSNDTGEYRTSKNEYLKSIATFKERLNKARELLLNGDIDSKDYKEIKGDCESNIMLYESELVKLSRNKYSKKELEPIIDKAIYVLTRLDAIFFKSDNYGKRKIIGSMFPEKFTFENLKARTANVSPVFNCIYLINKELQRNKKGQKALKSILPSEVLPPGLEPGTKRL
ncbi:recombinase family protein [Olivibacter sp. CPCC 100613]|uniref:recombinase family protein n=1 Tax=Olivibacter sp. CPCC 100613 TaxID=3079931 RepID=UPI002FFA596B